LQYLTRDLVKILPYSLPIIILNFDSSGGEGGLGAGSSIKDKKGMYFTTQEIWDKLYAQKKLP